MQVRLSKTLRRHLDAGMHEAQRTGNIAVMLDVAFLSLVREGMSHAGHILRKLLKDWEIYQLCTRIEKECAQAGIPATGISPAGGAVPSAQQCMANAVAGITGYCLAGAMLPARTVGTLSAQTAVANSGHFLQWIIDTPELISARQLEAAGVTSDQVTEYLVNMPADEDYYLDMSLLEQLGKPQILKIQLDSSHPRQEEGEDVPIRQTKSPSGRSKNKTRAMLDQFGTNLSVAAAKGEIDPVIGRQKEIERLIQILGRRKKNNPILVGEAGVGKSAIVEGLALRMASGDVPRSLAGKEVFSLDIASLVAGTKYRGEFEQRIKGLINELQKSKDIILFIDEIHTIAGAGSTQGSLDTANILKPSLARGELQCIGATTLDEYREHIESDSALERRFQKIIVEPTTRQQTLTILENIKGQYEKHHSVRYSDEALRACVDLTERYITDRQFPDKAIDVLDEAGSKARIFGPSEPDMVRELEKALTELEARLAAEKNPEGSPDSLRALSLREKINEYRAQWQREVSLNAIEITETHIEEVINSMTGIPVEKVSQGEKKKLVRMEEHLGARVIGQESAVSKVTRSIQRSRTGLKDPNKPIGVFMFVGPTGVGKTHLAKELSKWMFDKEDSLIRVDMSEYSEKHNVSRMIGSPPGYVGYNEGGQLTEAVRRQPYAVILFDEIEKAHPDVFNIMLQIFDEGQLTDGLGRKVDFRNTVIIMTSNVGSRAAAQKPKAVGYKTPVKERIEILGQESQYRGALEKTFAPEFINRIDDIVIFNTLGGDDIQRIVGLELTGLAARARSLGYELNVTPKARKTLATLGYEPRYGVRSLKRTILDLVEQPIAQLIVGGKLTPGDTIRVESRGQGIEVLRQMPVLKKSC